MKKFLFVCLFIFCFNTHADLPKVYPQKVKATIHTLPDNLAKQWREEGFCLVDGLFTKEQVADLRAAIITDMGTVRSADFGGIQFPAGPRQLATVALDERLLDISMQLLGTDRVELSQAEAWAKLGTPKPSAGYKVFDNYDQRLHMDFPNHTMMHPPTWYNPEAVAMIIYLDDHKQTGGMTAVRPRLGADDPAYKYPYINMPGVANWPYINDRASAEEYIKIYDKPAAEFREQIYKELKYAAFKPGTVLFYRHDIWHRGTPLNNDAERVVVNLVYKKPGLPWFCHWSKAFARNLYDWTDDPTTTAPAPAKFAQLIPQLSIKQRAALGFPLPDEYVLNEQMLVALQARYPDINLDDYRLSMVDK